MRKTGFWRRHGVSYFMLSFWLAAFMIFIFIPTVSAIVLSFTSYDLISGPRLVWLDNYIRLFLNDDVFVISMKNTLLFAVITGPLGYILSFTFAWFINDLGDRLRPFFTLLFYIPTLAGNVYFVWIYIFSGDSRGILNGLLMRRGFITQPVQWLTDPKYNFSVVVLVILWMSMGAGFLSFVAGFKQLNASLYEAGSIDGIRNRWQELYYVTLPQMVPQLLIGAVLSISGAFAVGMQSQVLTGMPSTEYSTHTLLLHMIDMGSGRYEMGYASAVAVVLFIMMVLSWQGISKALSRLSSD